MEQTKTNETIVHLVRRISDSKIALAASEIRLRDLGGDFQSLADTLKSGEQLGTLFSYFKRKKIDVATAETAFMEFQRLTALIGESKAELERLGIVI